MICSVLVVQNSRVLPFQRVTFSVPSSTRCCKSKCPRFGSAHGLEHRKMPTISKDKPQCSRSWALPNRGHYIILYGVRNRGPARDRLDLAYEKAGALLLGPSARATPSPRSAESPAGRHNPTQTPRLWVRCTLSHPNAAIVRAWRRWACWTA